MVWVFLLLIQDYFDSFLQIYLFHRAKTATEDVNKELFNPKKTK